MQKQLRPDAAVALLLPGRRYSVDLPAMYYPAEVARSLGWRTQAVSWEGLDGSDESVLKRGREALHAMAVDGAVVIGKSLGSMLAGAVAELNIPAVWLTPVLSDARVRAGIQAQRAPALLVGGTGDELWDSEFAHGTGHQVLELVGGNHALQLPGNLPGSARFLATLTERVEAFIAPFSP